jgi:hypothetical protein
MLADIYGPARLPRHALPPALVFRHSGYLRRCGVLLRRHTCIVAFVVARPRRLWW